MANHSRSSRKPQSTPEQDFIEGFFRGAWQVASFMFKRSTSEGKKSGNKAQLAEIREHWQDVELHLLKPATMALSVGEADKLLDAAFLSMGFSGQSMGERLKAAEKWFPVDLYQEIWQAHKLRNSLAHEVGAAASQSEAKQAVGSIRKALYHLQILN